MHRDPEEAYRLWLKKKHQQYVKERRIEYLRRQTEEVSFFPSAEECDRAFREWVGSFLRNYIWNFCSLSSQSCSYLMVHLCSWHPHCFGGFCFVLFCFAWICPFKLSKKYISYLMLFVHYYEIVCQNLSWKEWIPFVKKGIFSSNPGSLVACFGASLGWFSLWHEHEVNPV